MKIWRPILLQALIFFAISYLLGSALGGFVKGAATATGLTIGFMMTMLFMYARTRAKRNMAANLSPDEQPVHQSIVVVKRLGGHTKVARGALYLYPDRLEFRPTTEKAKPFRIDMERILSVNTRYELGLWNGILVCLTDGEVIEIIYYDFSKWKERIDQLRLPPGPSPSHLHWPPESVKLAVKHEQ